MSRSIKAAFKPSLFPAHTYCAAVRLKQKILNSFSASVAAAQKNSAHKLQQYWRILNIAHFFNTYNIAIKETFAHHYISLQDVTVRKTQAVQNISSQYTVNHMALCG